jgi:hypothetical protein
MLRRLAEQHSDWRLGNWSEVAANLALPAVWHAVKPDAVWNTPCDEIIVAEAYARIGKLKSGHRRKLGLDALKLLAIQRMLPNDKQIRCLLVVPSELKGQIEGDGWFPAALRLAAEITPIELLECERRKLVDACEQQALGNRKAVGPA